MPPAEGREASSGAAGGARCSPSSAGAFPGSSSPCGPAEAGCSTTVAARTGVHVAVALAVPPEAASDRMTQGPPALERLCFCSHAAGSSSRDVAGASAGDNATGDITHMPASPWAFPKTEHIPEPSREGHLPRLRPPDGWSEDSGSRPCTTLWQFLPE